VRKFFVHPLAPLLLFSVALTALLIAYVIGGVVPSETFDILASFVWSILLAWWVVTDARRRESIPCFDFGFFCYVFFPVIFPAYCFWSRGWRGFLLLIVVFSTWMVPYIIAGFAWAVRYG
jgi:hypothetical protein